MKKKIYEAPSTEVVTIEGTTILAGSDPKINAGDPDSDEEQELPDASGNVWAD